MYAIEPIEFMLLFIFSIAIFLGLLFSTVPSNNKRANIYLGLFLWSIALTIYNIMFVGVFIEEKFHRSLLLFEPFFFHLLFLVLYLYKTINKKITNWFFLLFIPGIFHNIFLYSDDFSFSGDSLSVLEYSFYLFEIGIVFNALRILQKHNKSIESFYSDIEKKSLRWLKMLFILILTFHVLIVISDIIELLEGDWTSVELGLLYPMLLILIFTPYWIGYNGFYQPEIFREHLFLSENSDVQIEGAELQLSSVQSAIDSAENLQKFEEMKKQIGDQKLYTDPKLNLSSLSEILGLSERESSNLINGTGQVNFYRFINEFRVEEFKSLMQSTKAEQLSILGLAYEAGFPSKSTFYKVFKDIEGVTPSEYLNGLKKSYSTQ